jgi:hypothetical protein
LFFLVGTFIFRKNTIFTHQANEGMTRILILLFSLLPYLLNAQVHDNFNDGDFSANPVWIGDAAEFTVNATQQLQLNSTGNNASFLSTNLGVTLANTVEWKMYVKQTFAGSASNFGRVYLFSDQANLEGALNGYYLQFGEALSNDAIELFKQSGTTSTSIARGTNAQIAASFAVGVRVTRDVADYGHYMLIQVGEAIMHLKQVEPMQALPTLIFLVSPLLILPPTPTSFFMTTLVLIRYK